MLQYIPITLDVMGYNTTISIINSFTDFEEPSFSMDICSRNIRYTSPVLNLFHELNYQTLNNIIY